MGLNVRAEEGMLSMILLFESNQLKS